MSTDRYLRLMKTAMDQASPLKVHAVPPDKSDRILAMVKGHGDLSKFCPWIQQTKTAADDDANNSTSGAEWLYTLAGAGGGSLLGYLLAHLIHRKPKSGLKWLYALSGAAAGGLGTQVAMDSFKGKNGKTWRDNMREAEANQDAIREKRIAEAEANTPEAKKKAEEAAKPKIDPNGLAAAIARNPFTTAGLTYGAVSGALGKGPIDASGWRFAQRTMKEMADAGKDMTPGGADRTARALSIMGQGNAPRWWEIWKKRRNRVGEMVRAAPDVMHNGKIDWMQSTPMIASRVLGGVVDAGANAAVLGGVGKAIDWATESIRDPLYYQNLFGKK